MCKILFYPALFKFVVKSMLQMSLCISVQIHIHLMISDFFLSMLSKMRWIVFVRKLTGFINLTLCIHRHEFKVTVY